jgi:hypothetical protein
METSKLINEFWGILRSTELRRRPGGGGSKVFGHYQYYPLGNSYSSFKAHMRDQILQEALHESPHDPRLCCPDMLGSHHKPGLQFLPMAMSIALLFCFQQIDSSLGPQIEFNSIPVLDCRKAFSHSSTNVG